MRTTAKLSLQPRLRRHGHDDLHGHVGAGGRASARSIWGRGFRTRTDRAPSAMRRRKRSIEGPNQYPPTRGRIELRRAIAAHAKRFYDLTFDPDHEGAGHVRRDGSADGLDHGRLSAPGDEVVLIEPAYDSYGPMAEAAGAVVKTVKLAPPDWRLTEQALARGVHAEDARDHDQHAAQSHRPRVRSRGARGVARVLRKFERDRDLATRSMSISCSTAQAACPLINAARHGRARGARRLGRKNVLADGLEDRLGDGCGAACRCHRQGASVPHLHDVARAAARHRACASSMRWISRSG